ncbi:hypothetical protein KUV51_12005 [Tateyamaria omphalii]|uniref:hypothetical protein n=1 Tax=Tateyamaria omphalii TaxID=299262 RepID=UPI001C98EA4B|nr:hypothetical protein [Tateyamaria omphalii]MBY5933726.1 hypothetical protein [Tateyamaria omphalii]
MADPLVSSQIGLADPSAIVAKVTTFGNRPVSEWLSAGHPARNCQIIDPATNKGIRRLDRARAQLSDDQMVSLIAACGPNHCLDGWGYLSRSISALVARDGHSAKHMAYYAQLRAAMSMLAVSGIGIFNGLNICIDVNGAVHKLENTQENKGGENTHRIVWPALDAWLRIDSNAARFLSSVSLHGTNLKDALDSIWPNRQPVSIVLPLINAWAFDLSVATQHHEQRNISSYTPHELNALQCSFQDEMDFLSETWSALEPSAPFGFTQLDNHMLRRLFQMVHQQDNSAADPADIVQLDASPIATRYEELEPTLRQAVPKPFLLDETGSNEPQVFQMAATDGTTPRAMISRAVLLLRAATAMNTLTLHEAGFSPDGTEIRPWLDPLIVHRGITPAEKLPERMADLWDTTRYAVEDFQSSLVESAYEPNGFFAANQNGTPDVTQLERAAMWGMCP